MRQEAVQREKEAKETILGEVRALLVSRTYATREDLSRALAQSQANAKVANFISPVYNSVFQVGVMKEEVSGMIEKATSNFLRTVHGEPKNSGR